MKEFKKQIFVALTLISINIIGGYVFMKLWNWFIVYAVEVNSINFIQSIGIAFVVKYVIPSKPIEDEIDMEVFTKLLLKDLLKFGYTIGFGYLITLFQ